MPAGEALPPLDGVSVETDRWVGVSDGAAYRIEVPKVWNGQLVMWARGYWNGPSLYIENPMIRGHLLRQGFAWAASSYTKNLYDVKAAIEDTNKLAAQFQSIAAQKGRQVAAPRRIFIAGMSMGGHVAAAAVEAEVVRDARTPVRYDGALSMCGSVHDLEWFNYMAAYQMALQELLGFPAEAYPSQVYAVNQPAMRARIAEAVGRRDLSDPAVAKLYALMERLSGGRRPFFREGWQDPYHHNILFALMNGTPSLDGVLLKDAIDTRSAAYRFNDSLPLDADTVSFNQNIRRVVPQADANPLHGGGLRWVPLVSGQLTAPVLSLHTIGDLTVPIEAQVRYLERVTRMGMAHRLSQRLVRDIGHCSFTAAEVSAAFDDLARWAETGRRPAGDELADPALWSRSDVGCTHTNNLAGTEDRVNLTLRAQAQSAYSACSPRGAVAPSSIRMR